MINIDAHFDTRAEQQSTSGTSFRQILEEDENTGYLVLGIAQGGNTQSLFDYAKEKKIDYVFADELLSHVSPTIKDMIERFIHEHDVIMFTICMDVIDSAFAPGVSAGSVRVCIHIPFLNWQNVLFQVIRCLQLVLLR